MKKLAGIFLALSSVLCSFAQEEVNLGRDQILGIQFGFHDFKTAEVIRNSSLSDAFRTKQFGKLKDMSAGLGVNYIKSFSKNFDFSTTLAGSYLAYPQQNKEQSTDEAFLLELDASVRGRMLPNKYWLNPYVQLGAGIFQYSGYWGAYIPAGVGLQIKFFDEAYFLVNSQYRIPVTQTANYHFYYSIGIAGSINGRMK